MQSENAYTGLYSRPTCYSYRIRPTELGLGPIHSFDYLIYCRDGALLPQNNDPKFSSLHALGYCLQPSTLIFHSFT